MEGAPEQQGHVWSGNWHRGTFQYGNLSLLPKLSSDPKTWCVSDLPLPFKSLAPPVLNFCGNPLKRRAELSRGRVQKPALINPDLCRVNDKGH